MTNFGDWAQELWSAGIAKLSAVLDASAASITALWSFLWFTPQGPAVVQAVGTVATVIVAVWIASRDGRARKAEARRREIGKVMAARTNWALVLDAVAQARAITVRAEAAFLDVQSGKGPLFARTQPVREYDAILEDLRELALRPLPERRALMVRALRSAVNEARAAVSRGCDVVGHPGLHDQDREQLAKAKNALIDLHERHRHL